MKKTITILLGFLLSAPFVGAQIPDLENFAGIFQDFSDSVAPALPMTAAVGSTWSDAYIGSILGVPPHLGLGVTLGGTLIPVDGLKTLLSSFSSSSQLPEFFVNNGVPLPAMVVDGRIGGIILPFDVGFKIGFLPDAVRQTIPGDLSFEYLMYGVDARLALIQENGLLPGVSVGLGYTNLSTTMGFRPFSTDPQVGNVPYIDDNGTSGDTSDDTLENNGFIKMADPELKVTWKSSVIDLKLHVDKNLAIIMVYGGLGASLGLSEAGGGLYSKLKYTKNDGTVIAEGEAAKTAIEQAATQAGVEVPTISADGISSLSSVNGWSFRGYAGVALQFIPFVRLDLQGMYDIISKSYGGSLGFRIQL